MSATDSIHKNMQYISRSQVTTPQKESVQWNHRLRNTESHM